MKAPVGHFFNVMTNGWGAMGDYSAQIPVADRWRIAAYIRALQLSQTATAGDVPAGTAGGQPRSRSRPAANCNWRNAARQLNPRRRSSTMSTTTYPASYRFEPPPATASLATRWLAIGLVAVDCGHCRSVGFHASSSSAATSSATCWCWAFRWARWPC